MVGDEARYLNTHFRLATWALTHVWNRVILFIYFEHVLCESKSAWWHDKASATLCLFTNSIWFDNITNRSVEFYRNSSLRFLCFLLIKRLLFDLDPRSLILIPFHGGRLCNMGCIYFPKTSPHTSPLFPIREMELGIYSTMVEGVGISSIGASSPLLPRKHFYMSRIQTSKRKQGLGLKVKDCNPWPSIEIEGQRYGSLTFWSGTTMSGSGDIYMFPLSIILNLKGL